MIYNVLFVYMYKYCNIISNYQLEKISGILTVLSYSQYFNVMIKIYLFYLVQEPRTRILLSQVEVSTELFLEKEGFCLKCFVYTRWRKCLSVYIHHVFIKLKWTVTQLVLMLLHQTTYNQRYGWYWLLTVPVTLKLQELQLEVTTSVCYI